MNLSSYLQMPPAPLVPASPSNATPQGVRLGAGSSTGANLGFDFAQVMARQLERLVPQERQTLAADALKQPELPARTPEHTQHIEDKRNANRASNDERTNEDTTDKDNTSEQPATPAHHRAKVTSAPKTDADTLLAGLMQGAPITPLAAPITPATAAAVAAPLTTVTPNDEEAANLTSAASLQTIELSPQVRIITDPKQAPSPESLAAFAKSMGLDESAIQNLLGQAPDTAPTASAGTATDLASPTSVGLTAAMGTALSGLPKGLTTDAMPMTNSAVASQLAAMQASAEPAKVVVSGAGLAAAATTLTAPTVVGLTPTDMAAIQQLQITVLPPVVLPIHTAIAAPSTPVPSTVDMLSLLGTGVDEQDVSALLSRFSEETGSDSNPDQQPSQGEGNNFSSFAQALNRSNNASNGATASAAPTGANMSEVYDQLSDKMATEMAARMHKQLSDGEWKMKFALRPSNLGGVEIQLEMKDGKLDAVFRADNPLTRDLLQNSSQRLREALGNFGINAGQVNVGQGGGNTPQNNSGGTGKQPQVRDNSTSQVNGTGSASSATSTRNKANASLLDLYA
jgi:flagellar hook-length control protein FliK